MVCYLVRHVTYGLPQTMTRYMTIDPGMLHYGGRQNPWVACALQDLVETSLRPSPAIWKKTYLLQ